MTVDIELGVLRVHADGSYDEVKQLLQDLVKMSDQVPQPVPVTANPAPYGTYVWWRSSTSKPLSYQPGSTHAWIWAKNGSSVPDGYAISVQSAPALSIPSPIAVGSSEYAQEAK